MDLRTRVNEAVKQAMKDKAPERLSTLRLINAAIKDRDIAVRADGNETGVDEAEVLSILGKMVKQRRESARTYEEGGRLDLAERELAEIEVIEEFLPKALSDDEVQKAVDAAVTEVGADSIRDMGRVMGALKTKYAGQMDFGAVGKLVKDRLASGA
ncbi:GatB/YqeY domain-containing protein [Thalassococcus sp. CAU 1522]|uniref:GatB/YqeY domain-containing protein n=1 Tax=Thalassococcus arenae TaxID=2851652 RepID=A0ABS6N3T8_9RHOB|nr:GatB/YqeY domain-containing protein [Thalassococcus arenae]MBV2358254.1 GatB/YqeY domain-containing protein [Thalassococcus arenae]